MFKYYEQMQINDYGIMHDIYYVCRTLDTFELYE